MVIYLEHVSSGNWEVSVLEYRQIKVKVIKSSALCIHVL